MRREKLAHRMAAYPAPAEKPAGDGLLSAAQVFAALTEIRPAHAVLVEESPSNISALSQGMAHY
jgi:benzoylformate decarboxylase